MKPNMSGWSEKKKAGRIVQGLSLMNARCQNDFLWHSAWEKENSREEIESSNPPLVLREEITTAKWIIGRNMEKNNQKSK